jgi:hypothetical protein
MFSLARPPVSYSTCLTRGVGKSSPICSPTVPNLPWNVRSSKVDWDYLRLFTIHWRICAREPERAPLSGSGHSVTILFTPGRCLNIRLDTGNWSWIERVLPVFRHTTRQGRNSPVTHHTGRPPSFLPSAAKIDYAGKKPEPGNL